MKSDQLLRAASALLLFTLNILAGQIIGSMKDLKTDMKLFGAKIVDVQIRLSGAEKDISILQKSPASQASPQFSVR